MMPDALALSDRLVLRPMTQNLAEYLGPAIAGIEPWSRINFHPAMMTTFLAMDDPALTRMAVHVDDMPAGAIAVRSPWLRGPYLQLLAMLPPYQGQGFGTMLLDWFAGQAGPHARWLWLCYSSFNPRAGALYTRYGFEQVAPLTDLIEDGLDEILMRKRINKPQ